jgi:hypothetical protein
VYLCEKLPRIVSTRRLPITVRCRRCGEQGELQIRSPMPQRAAAKRQDTYARVLRRSMFGPSLLIIDEDD